MNKQESMRVPRFTAPDVDTFRSVLEAKANFQYGHNEMYFRDGFPDLNRLEEHVAMLVGSEKEHVLLTNSGMSALTTAVEIASLTAGDAIVHSFQGYSQTRELITEDLVERGIKPVGVDSGSLLDIENAVKKYRPKVVLFETVINGPAMSLLDVEGLLALSVLYEVNPIIILDNTFPTNTNLPLSSYLKKTSSRTIGVESATKSYALNQELGGIMFTYDPLCLEKLYIKRRRIGTTPGPSAVATIQAVVSPTKEQFDREHRVVTRNTLLLAQACADIGSNRFVVSYPNLPTHPNYAYANTYYPYGAAPAFFIQPAGDLSAIAIAKVLQETGVLNNCRLAQSFCFDKTGVSFDLKGTYLRIAGGLEDAQQISELRAGFVKALSAFTEG